MRRTVLLLVLCASAVLPGSALAAVPSNDTQAGAVVLVPTYAPASYTLPPIPPTGPGAWNDATSTEDSSLRPPSCLNFNPSHSMWYSIVVKEASVLSISLTSNDVTRYQPVVSITDGGGGEVACGLGGSDRQTDPTASASSFVIAGTYFVRIGSLQAPTPGASTSEGPTLRLSEMLRDVTPPEIRVSVSGQSRIVGPGKPYKFNATASIDLGSDTDPATAMWSFPDPGKEPVVVAGKDLPNPLIVEHSWQTAGVHQVILQLADKSGNLNTYSFTVLVHNFVPPRVGLLVSVPAPGARRIRFTVTHDVPVRVRLVIMQNGRVLRVLPAKLLEGPKKKTKLSVALKRKVGKVGFVAISGVASDLGESPNTVPLLTCSVDPVNGGGKCG